MNLSELMLTVEELCNVTVSLEEVGTAGRTDGFGLGKESSDH